MAASCHLYDTSEFRNGHLLSTAENKGVLGKMKDECAGRPIAEYGGSGQRCIRSSRLAQKHEAKHLNKVSLSLFGANRRISKNGVGTLAYGHNVRWSRPSR